MRSNRMKRIKNQVRIAVFLLLFLYLLLFQGPARLGARNGLVLWYNSVLPVLFPFMLLSGAALRLNVMDCLPDLLRQLVCRVFKCSQNGCFAIVMGFFCGFPMGAKITSDLFFAKKTDGAETRHLLGFVNNVSPVFLTSFLAAQQLDRPDLSVFFLCSILGAAILYGICTAPKRPPKTEIPSKPSVSRSSRSCESGGSAAAFSVIDEVINDSVYSIVKLGVCIMVFSMLESAVSYFWKSDGMLSLFVRSGIEITGGIRLLCDSAMSLPQKYTALCALCAFGGWSSVMQTAAVAKLTPALTKYYIKSRVIITLLSILLSGIILFFFRRFFR